MHACVRAVQVFCLCSFEQTEDSAEFILAMIEKDEKLRAFYKKIQ